MTQDERLQTLKNIRWSLQIAEEKLALRHANDAMDEIRSAKLQLTELIENAAKGEVTKPKTKTRVLAIGTDEGYLHENCEDVTYKINNYLKINPDAKVLFPPDTCINDNDGGFALTLVVEIPEDALPE